MTTHGQERFIGPVEKTEAAMRKLLKLRFIQQVDKLSKLANVNALLFA